MLWGYDDPDVPKVHREYNGDDGQRADCDEDRIDKSELVRSNFKTPYQKRYRHTQANRDPPPKDMR
jgi:hypothetical protein